MDQHEVDWARGKLTAAADDATLWAVVLELAHARLAPDTWPELADLVRPVLSADLQPEVLTQRMWQLSIEGVPWFRSVILDFAQTYDDGPLAQHARWVASEMERPNRWLTSYDGPADALTDPEIDELLETVELEDRSAAGASIDDIPITIAREPSQWQVPTQGAPAGAPPAAVPVEAPTAVPVSAPARPAYPLIKCAPVWVTDMEEQVTIGMSPKALQAVGGTGAVVGANETTVDDLTVTLLLDPRSIALAAGAPRTYALPVTAEQRYPIVTVGLTAAADDTLATERRIGLHYRRGGRSVGLAWRRITAVDFAEDVAGAAAPAPPSDLLDLSSLVEEEAPDLVLAAYRGDDAAGSALVWEAFSARDEDDLPDPATAKATFNGAEGADFAARVRAAIESSKGVPLFTELKGIGAQVAHAVPAEITALLRRTASRPSSPDAPAPTVLLLTEDPSVPWELAVPKEPALTSDRTTSPFLGAHLAIARWPLVPGKPRPVPRSRQQITAGAVLSAAYDQVKNWPRLPQAEAEAAELLKAYGGTPVEPRWTVVRDCLEGTPPVDWLHVALHGKFDVTGAKDGLVLLDGPPGDLTPQFFKTTHIDALTLSRGPFVFLNACQVGSGNTVLGNYGGMAVSLLRAGASAVVAAMWNVDDAVAAAITARFYAATLPLDGTTAVSVAEALRRERASYTEDRVTADPTTCTPTLLAYQLHGHPGLTLSRTAAPAPAPAPA